MKDTCSVLDANGIPSSGAGMHLKEASRPLILVAGGLRVGVIFAADSRYNPAGDNTPGTNPANPEMIRKTISSLKSDADLTIVSFHMGMDYTSVPTPTMRSLAGMCLEEGARVVQFHHAHRISGISRQNRGVVLWGCGNYAFCTERSPWLSRYAGGAAWILNIDRDTARVGAVGCRPITTDSHGFPVILEPGEARSIKRRVDDWSRRIDRAKALNLWRVVSLVHPAYIRLSAPNYLYMCRRQGVGAVSDSIRSTIQIQWCRHRS